MDIRMVYSYDGSKFYGMQRQKNKITVQGEIERVIFEVFNEKINLISSGRTDRGVHALMQVSNFKISKTIPPIAIKKQLNKALYGKIKVYNIDIVDKDFNSRYMATYRTYLYRLKYIDDISPFEASYISEIRKDIDIEKINKKLALFVGEHDFTLYSKSDKDQKNPVRKIYSANCIKINDEFQIIIKGNSFLKSMIRLIVASCIYEDEKTIINKLNGIGNGPKKILSPNGLYLKEVCYDN